MVGASNDRTTFTKLELFASDLAQMVGAKFGLLLFAHFPSIVSCTKTTSCTAPKLPSTNYFPQTQVCQVYYPSRSDMSGAFLCQLLGDHQASFLNIAPDNARTHMPVVPAPQSVEQPSLTKRPNRWCCNSPSSPAQKPHRSPAARENRKHLMPCKLPSRRSSMEPQERPEQSCAQTFSAAA